MLQLPPGTPPLPLPATARAPEPSSGANPSQPPRASVGSGRRRRRKGPDAHVTREGRVGGPGLQTGLGSGGPGPRLYFQSHPGAAGEGLGGADDGGPVRHQGNVRVKYDGKELLKRLSLEEWILEQLTRLYDCQVCPPPCADTLNLFRFGPPGNPTLSPPVTRRQWASSLSALPCSLYSPPPMYALSCLT